jgi:steroid delta-isomerase-like uncharacterized protein
MCKEEQNKEVVRKAIDAFNKQDLALYLSYHTENYTSREVFYPEPLTREEVAEFMPRYWHAYPDAHVDTQYIYAEGDRVIVENIMSGTLENDFDDLKATGRSFKVWEACVFDMKDGKIEAARVYTDRLTINEQLGAP